MNKQDISVDFADMGQTEIASQADGNYTSKIDYYNHKNI